MNTLFSPHYPNVAGVKTGMPYSVAVSSIVDAASSRLDDDELIVFQDVLAHEISYYQPRGYIVGDVVIKTRHYAELLSCDHTVQVPSCVEDIWHDINSCSAECIVLVEHLTVFRHIANTQMWRELPMILATGCGVPRIEFRRTLRWLVDRLSIPLYVICDNDTWGYFIASLLSRGTLDPSSFYADAAIDDVRYLGMLSAQSRSEHEWQHLSRQWRPVWDLRMAEMRKYPCFASAEWMDEFDGFVSQHCAIDLESVIALMGLRKFFSHYILKTVTQSQFLRCCPTGRSST